MTGEKRDPLKNLSQQDRLVYLCHVGEMVRDLCDGVENVCMLVVVDGNCDVKVTAVSKNGLKTELHRMADDLAVWLTRYVNKKLGNDMTPGGDGHRLM